MESDIWGFLRTLLVLVCFLVVCALTTETEEGSDESTVVALFLEI